MRIYIISALAVLIIGAVVLMNIRRELPYHFDIVRTEDGVAVVNVESWVTRSLNVRIEQGGKVLASGTIDPETHSGVFNDIGSPGQSQVIISRTDIVGRLLYKTKKIPVDLNGQAQDYIILVGASIGQSWNLPEFPERISNDRLAFGHRVKYEFDKTDLIEPIFNYRVKPKAVIIKECSAYFPRDLADSEQHRKRWVGQLLDNGIIPVFATTTPVGKSTETKEQQESIDVWNKSIRKMARKERYHVLDLASALKTGMFDTYLKPGYFIDDGLHMTPLAYEEGFDPTLKELLDDIL